MRWADGGKLAYLDLIAFRGCANGNPASHGLKVMPGRSAPCKTAYLVCCYRVEYRWVSYELDLMGGCDTMRVYMILTLALLLAPFASAVPDIASQTIDSTVSGADTATMDGTNTATVSSNDAVLSQSVSQIADATAATQTQQRVPDSTGDGVALGQSIVQASIGDTSDQKQKIMCLLLCFCFWR
jgi:hypothetical protein